MQWLRLVHNGGMNDETTPEKPVEAQPAETPRVEAQPEEPRGPDPRRRLRELLATPERDRSDAVWDEIINLEIELAPGNRIAPGGQQDPNRRQDMNGQRQDQNRRPDQGRRQGQQPGQNQGKRSGQRHGRGPKQGMPQQRKPV